jgi:hypothetical protein
MSVPLSITSPDGLTIGPASNIKFKNNASALYIENTRHSGGNISLRTTRLDGVTKTDNIFVFEHGKIAQSGNHDKLMQNKDGLYMRLWKEKDK